MNKPKKMVLKKHRRKRKKLKDKQKQLAQQANLASQEKKKVEKTSSPS